MTDASDASNSAFDAIRFHELYGPIRFVGGPLHNRFLHVQWGRGLFLQWRDSDGVIYRYDRVQLRSDWGTHFFEFHWNGAVYSDF